MQPGDVISYIEMCSSEGASLQRGMNYQLGPDHSVPLMSMQPGAPYDDSVSEDGGTLIYEGHDEPKTSQTPDPKSVDQPLFTPNGALTQNGRFFQAAEEFRNGLRPAERVRVYEKVRAGVWVYTGLFHLVDAWIEPVGRRSVCRFRLSLVHTEPAVDEASELENPRVIPTTVKINVWSRDKGRCIECGATDNLHFDHIIPYSKGGSSLTADNIQLLCARHNLAKRDRIQ